MRRRRRRRRRRRGQRRAVAGAERGGSGEGTRLARLAASARTSTPQPCASRALVSVSATPSTAEAAELWATGRLTGTAVPSATFCAAEKVVVVVVVVIMMMGGWVRGLGGLPQSSILGASPSRGAAPSSLPRLGAGRAVPARC